MAESTTGGHVFHKRNPDAAPTLTGMNERVGNLEIHFSLMRGTLDRISNTLIAIAILMVGGLITVVLKMNGA